MELLSAWQTFLLGLLASLPAIILALAGLLQVLRRIGSIHTIVNSQRAEMIREIANLKQVIAGLLQQQAVDQERQKHQGGKDEAKS